MNSKMLQIVEIEGRGRALMAAQPLNAGQIVLRESPVLTYSAFPFSSVKNMAYCSNCFRTLSSHNLSSSESMVSCPSCSQNHVFCSPSCLSSALSSSHSTWACRALSCLRDCPSLMLDQPLERQVEARFLVAAYNLALVSPSHFQLLLSLQGHSVPYPPEIYSAAQFLHSLIASLFPPPILLDGFSTELTAALLSKDKLNAFGLMEPFSAKDGGERSVRAYAIYHTASFFNHDCLPNACRFDYVDSAPNAQHRNTDIVVRMIHDVPQGREICLSYFPVNLSYSTRQKRLIDDYGFTCLCDRCKVESNWPDDGDGDRSIDESEEAMEDDEDEDYEATAQNANNADDFPHEYFFLSYVCNRENCGGTLAPLPPKDEASPTNLLECNVCGELKSDCFYSNGGEDSMDD